MKHKLKMKKYCVFFIFIKLTFYYFVHILHFLKQNDTSEKKEFIEF